MLDLTEKFVKIVLMILIMCLAFLKKIRDCNIKKSKWVNPKPKITVKKNIQNEYKSNLHERKKGRKFC